MLGRGGRCLSRRTFELADPLLERGDGGVLVLDDRQGSSTVGVRSASGMIGTLNRGAWAIGSLPVQQACTKVELSG